MDFSNYLDKFSSLEPIEKNRLNDKEVINEETNFFYNIKLYHDCNLFLKGCFEVYLILVKQLDDMTIPQNINKKLIQYLQRARLNTSNLIFTAKNAYFNFKNDQKIVKNQLVLINEINQKEILKQEKIEKGILENNNEDLTKMNRKKVVTNLNKNVDAAPVNKLRVDLTEKIRRQFIFKLNDENQRNTRLNNVLTRYLISFFSFFFYFPLFNLIFILLLEMIIIMKKNQKKKSRI
jgi:hypothetical protein